MSSERAVMSDSEHLERGGGGYTVAERGGGGCTVADLSKTKSLSRQINRATKGSTLKRADAAWYICQ